MCSCGFCTENCNNPWCPFTKKESFMKKLLSKLKENKFKILSYSIMCILTVVLIGICQSIDSHPLTFVIASFYGITYHIPQKYLEGRLSE